MTETFQPVPVTSQDERLFAFACPVCRGALVDVSATAVRCPTDDLTFRCEAGIWRFLPPERAAVLAQFRQEYETVRQHEGRGSDEPAFYQTLPFIKEKQPQISQIGAICARIFSLRSPRSLRLDSWAVRAQSFVTLLEQVIEPLERRVAQPALSTSAGSAHALSKSKWPLRILDLGAGNGWLSNRLAARGHWLAAVDLGVNSWDGLGAQRHYSTTFTCLQAEFDHLPLDDNQADLVIFNAAFHYSVNYGVTLREALRVLRPGGLVAVMDTAVYQHQTSGEKMVAEREATFKQQLGFASNALPSENFLTPQRLHGMATALKVSWQQIDTVPQWRRWIRQVKVALRRQREPAQFPIIIFTAEDAESAEFFERKEGGIKDSADWRRLRSDFSLFSASYFDSTQHKPALSAVKKNSLWLFGARMGQQAILLLFTVLVARQLGEVGLGQLAWVTAVLYIGNVFSTFGLDTVLLRHIAAERRTSSVPLAAALGLQLVLSAVFIVLIYLLPFAGQTADTVGGLRLYAWVLLPLAISTLTSAALRGYEQMGWLAGLTLGTVMLQVGGAAVLFVVGGDFQSLMLWLLLVQIASAGASWWLCRRTLPDFGLNWQLLNFHLVKQLAQVGFWLALLMVVSVLLQRLGILLVGWLGTEAQTGQLAAALRLVEAARLLPGAVMGAAFPALARWRTVGTDNRIAGQIRWSLAAYGLVAALGLALLARPLILLLFDDGYDTAAALLQILAWGIVPFALALPISVELVVAGREKLVLLATGVTLLGTAVAAPILFLSNGLPVLAWVLVIGEWLLVVLLFVLGTRVKLA